MQLSSWWSSQPSRCSSGPTTGKPRIPRTAVAVAPPAERSSTVTMSPGKSRTYERSPMKHRKTFICFLLIWFLFPSFLGAVQSPPCGKTCCARSQGGESLRAVTPPSCCSHGNPRMGTSPLTGIKPEPCCTWNQETPSEVIPLPSPSAPRIDRVFSFSPAIPDPVTPSTSGWDETPFGALRTRSSTPPYLQNCVLIL